jgi:hypothetical protein
MWHAGVAFSAGTGNEVGHASKNGQPRKRRVRPVEVRGARSKTRPLPPAVYRQDDDDEDAVHDSASSFGGRSNDHGGIDRSHESGRGRPDLVRRQQSRPLSVTLGQQQAHARDSLWSDAMFSSFLFLFSFCPSNQRTNEQLRRVHHGTFF